MTPNDANGSDFFYTAVEEYRALENRMPAELHCRSCSSPLTVLPMTDSAFCELCKIRTELPIESPLLRPAEMIPFSITAKQAALKSGHWAKNQWLYPKKYRDFLSDPTSFTSVFLPYWVFSFHVAATFTGTKTEYEFSNRRKEGVSFEDSLILPKSESSDIVKDVSWHTVSGTLAGDFSDFAICASAVLSPRTPQSPNQWNISDAMPINDRYLKSYPVQRFTLSLQDGFHHARKLVKVCFEKEAVNKMGGHSQKVTSCSCSYDQISHRFILCPHWIAEFKRGKRTYQVSVNGQTGRVAGMPLISLGKAVGVAVGIIALFVLAGYAYLANQV